jgi:hypothetical protein
MKNEERAQLEAQHQKEVDNLQEEVARLTSLLEQALKDKSGKAILIAQPEDMHITQFDLWISSQHTPQEFCLSLILPRKNLKRAR